MKSIMSCVLLSVVLFMVVSCDDDVARVYPAAPTTDCSELEARYLAAEARVTELEETLCIRDLQLAETNRIINCLVDYFQCQGKAFPRDCYGRPIDIRKCTGE